MEKIQFLGLLAKGKTKECIESLLEIIPPLEEEECYSQLVLLSNQYANLNNEKKNGILSFEEKNLTNNRINASLLSFINEIDFTSLKIYPKTKGSLKNANKLIEATNLQAKGDISATIDQKKGSIKLDNINSKRGNIIIDIKQE